MIHESSGWALCAFNCTGIAEEPALWAFDATGVSKSGRKRSTEADGLETLDHYHHCSYEKVVCVKVSEKNEWKMQTKDPKIKRWISAAHSFRRAHMSLPVSTLVHSLVPRDVGKPSTSAGRAIVASGIARRRICVMSRCAKGRRRHRCRH